MQKDSKHREYIRMTAVLGMLSALAVICAMPFPTGLTFRVGGYIKFSPMFLAVCLAGSLYGKWASAAVAFIGDFFQSLLSGLGLSPLILGISFLTGLCFGAFLHNSKSMVRITASVLLTQIVGSLILTTLALRLRYSIPIEPMLYYRLLQTAILTVAEIFCLWLCIRVLDLPSKIKKLNKA